MAKRASSQFINQHSVRFNLHSFALPVAVNRKKNTIYTNYLAGLKGTTQKLLPKDTPTPTHGYTYATQWSSWVFTADSHGLYYADVNLLRFQTISQTVIPNQLCTAHNRLFIISMDRRRLIYSHVLTGEWSASDFLEGAIFVPENYGLCLDIRQYRDKLLVICENGLLLVRKNLLLTHLSEDSENLKANLVTSDFAQWQSDWFSLGYATDTQTLREVFIKTDVPLVLTVESNRSQRVVTVKPSPSVQKLKTNLNGDQFKLAINIIGSATDFCVTNLAGVIVYGRRR